MQLLYVAKYKKRFFDILQLVSKNDTSVIELCFGDVIIAQECKRRKISWTGLDINDYFVQNAKSKGFNASVADIGALQSLPKADVCIISGSLYHFIADIEKMLKKLLDSAPKVILSEPVVNLSSKQGIIGNISKILTNAGKGKESFRFDKTSIIETLEKYKTSLHFSYTVINCNRDILIEIKHDRN